MILRASLSAYQGIKPLAILYYISTKAVPSPWINKLFPGYSSLDCERDSLLLPKLGDLDLSAFKAPAAGKFSPSSLAVD